MKKLILEIPVFIIIALLVFSSCGSRKNDETSKNMNTPTADEYFNTFLNKKGGSLIEVFTMHQPSLSDCKVMFGNDYYKSQFRAINNTFVMLSGISETQNNRFEGKTACRATEFSTSDVSGLPGKVKRLATMLNPGIKCYKIDFLKNKQDEYGSSYYFFSKINGRWVYFPTN